ncbi:hypothetical protein GH733_016746 [Mirounga leonina]|nr:hypothetical protein GH733_016746 [Mirounga leonina]
MGVDFIEEGGLQGTANSVSGKAPAAKNCRSVHVPEYPPPLRPSARSVFSAEVHALPHAGPCWQALVLALANHQYVLIVTWNKLLVPKETAHTCEKSHGAKRKKLNRSHHSTSSWVREVNCQIAHARIERDMVVCTAKAHELPEYGVKTGLTKHATPHGTDLQSSQPCLNYHWNFGGPHSTTRFPRCDSESREPNADIHWRHTVVYKKKPKKELQKKWQNCSRISLAQKRDHVTHKRADFLRAQEPAPES